MNPYDFVRIDWDKAPLRHKPIWHHQLAGSGQQKLYSGHLELTIDVETPLFIFDPHRPKSSLRNMQGDYIIPGSSLKGLLRNVTEALCRGCLTLLDGNYQDAPYWNNGKIPDNFIRCSVNTRLCLSCRIFGMMQARRSYPGTAEGAGNIKDGNKLFLGKVNISDACCESKAATLYKSILAVTLMEPKPRHQDFYLDPTREHIAGRKFYFHHAYESIKRGNATKYSQDIQPLDKGTTFQTRIDFTSLEADEFAALLLAITLEHDMRHKIGYAKPLGLGSVHFIPTSLTLIDFTSRYTQMDAGHGKPTYTGDEIQQLRKELVSAHLQGQLVPQSWQDLQRIWRWPADSTVNYYYPSKSGWFDTEKSRGKRIADTRTTP
jgi:CRISPR/Cas system CSM-associated protein Csm3 (group 7 of RAMP superfamily)